MAKPKARGPEDPTPRKTIKVDSVILDRLHEVAQRDGLVLNRLVDRLLLAGLEGVERPEVKSAR